MAGLDPAQLSCDGSHFLLCLTLQGHAEHEELFAPSAHSQTHLPGFIGFRLLLFILFPFHGVIYSWANSAPHPPLPPTSLGAALRRQVACSQRRMLSGLCPRAQV